MLWLSRQLSGGIGDTTVLMVSHDAAFLDAVATDIILFRLKQLTYYAGNYSAYMKVGAACAKTLACRGNRVDLDPTNEIRGVLGWSVGPLLVGRAPGAKGKPGEVTDVCDSCTCCFAIGLLRAKKAQPLVFASPHPFSERTCL